MTHALHAVTLNLVLIYLTQSCMVLSVDIYSGICIEFPRCFVIFLSFNTSYLSKYSGLN